MQLPRVQGEIERRLLVNYRMDPDAAARVLPPPFRPQLVNGFAVAGICLIRLGSLRPMNAPPWIGLRSENAAHRIAVEWDTADGVRTGVYIPRRDTDALANALLGGRIYPGEQHRARFTVRESGDDVHVDYASFDGTTSVAVDVRSTDRLVGSELFADVEQASAFFQQGSVGLSATRDACRLDGMQLETDSWAVQAGQVTAARSSYYDDPTLFPAGSVALDCALVMRNVPVRWRALPSMHSRAGA